MANILDSIKIKNSATVGDWLGIGTLNPGARLHVYNGSAGSYTLNASHDDLVVENSVNTGIQLISPNTSYQYIAFGDPDSVNAGYIRYYHTNNEMVFRTSGGDRMIINSSGYVGIGTTTPTPKLHLQYSGGSYSSDSTSGFINEATTGRGTMRIRSATDNPAELFFDVDGAIRWDISCRNGSSPNLQFYPQAATPALNGVSAHTFELQQNGNVIVTGSGSSGKMGIRETNPDTALDVVGGSSDSVVDTLTLKNDSTGNSAGAGINFVVDGVNDVVTSAIYGQRTASAYHQGSLQFLTRDASGGGLLERMRINSNGNVGIGTDSPESFHKLEVNGFIGSKSSNPQLRVLSTANQSGYLVFGDAEDNDVGYIRYDHSANSMDFFVNTSERVTIDNQGNVGIGTTSPSAKLHSTGTILSDGNFSVSASSGRGFRFWNSDNYKIYMSYATDATWGGRVAGETTSDYNMYFKMNGGTNRGFVFGNNTTNVAGIDASGNIRTVADVVAYSSSDKRLKDNIKPIENAIDKVKKIGGYEFDWNDKQDTYEGHDVGVIAQEIEEVLPEVVTERDNGYKAVKYEKLVALLIQGMKEQQEQIDELKRRLDGSTK